MSTTKLYHTCVSHVLGFPLLPMTLMKLHRSRPRTPRVRTQEPMNLTPCRNPPRNPRNQKLHQQDHKRPTRLETTLLQKTETLSAQTVLLRTVMGHGNLHKEFYRFATASSAHPAMMSAKMECPKVSTASHVPIDEKSNALYNQDLIQQTKLNSG